MDLGGSKRSSRMVLSKSGADSSLSLAGLQCTLLCLLSLMIVNSLASYAAVERYQCSRKKAFLP